MGSKSQPAHSTVHAETHTSNSDLKINLVVPLTRCLLEKMKRAMELVLLQGLLIFGYARAANDVPKFIFFPHC